MKDDCHGDIPTCGHFHGRYGCVGHRCEYGEDPTGSKPLDNLPLESEDPLQALVLKWRSDATAMYRSPDVWSESFDQVRCEAALLLRCADELEGALRLRPAP